MEAQEEFIFALYVYDRLKMLYISVSLENTLSKIKAIQAIEENKYLAGNNTTGSGMTTIFVLFVMIAIQLLFYIHVDTAVYVYIVLLN